LSDAPGLEARTAHRLHSSDANCGSDVHRRRQTDASYANCESDAASSAQNFHAEEHLAMRFGFPDRLDPLCW
jgi:hypothetical protein